MPSVAAALFASAAVENRLLMIACITLAHRDGPTGGLLPSQPQKNDHVYVHAEGS
jgi:hypothetical protein